MSARSRTIDYHIMQGKYFIQNHSNPEIKHFWKSTRHYNAKMKLFPRGRREWKFPWKKYRNNYPELEEDTDVPMRK